MPTSKANDPQVPKGCMACNRPDHIEDMVACDDCGKWYHFGCANVDESVVDQSWKCQPCGLLLANAASNTAACASLNVPTGALRKTGKTAGSKVVTGGQYDVDVQLVSPTQEILYKQVKTQFDSHQFTAQATGIYAACFSNEFSTFSHKLIYMDFQVGDEQPLPGVDEHSTVLTQLESSSQEIHKSLNAILDYQTHHRLREAQGRKRAEDLNERVLWWSLTETVAILVIAIGQVIVLRNFFSEKKPSQMSYQQFK